MPIQELRMYLPEQFEHLMQHIDTVFSSFITENGMLNLFDGSIELTMIMDDDFETLGSISHYFQTRSQYNIVQFLESLNKERNTFMMTKDYVDLSIITIINREYLGHEIEFIVTTVERVLHCFIKKGMVNPDLIRVKCTFH